MGIWESIQTFLLNEFLGQLIPLVVTGLIGWIAVMYARLTGKELEARHREALQSALENGIKAGIQLVLKGKLAANGAVPESARGQVLDAAKNYVVTSVPDAVKHFKLSERGVVELLEPKLPIASLSSNN